MKTVVAKLFFPFYILVQILVNGFLATVAMIKYAGFTLFQPRQ
jgi:hypothetical protein